LQGRAQGLDGEVLRRHDCAQQVPVAKDEVALGGRHGQFAVRHQRKLRVVAQARGECPAHARERLGWRICHAYQQHLGRDPVAQLRHQQALVRRRALWQERRHVGRVAGLHDDPEGSAQECQPDDDDGAPRHVAYAVGCRWIPRLCSA
jgi:hypothetical protein